MAAMERRGAEMGLEHAGAAGDGGGGDAGFACGMREAPVSSGGLEQSRQSGAAGVASDRGDVASHAQ